LARFIIFKKSPSGLFLKIINLIDKKAKKVAKMHKINKIALFV